MAEVKAGMNAFGDQVAKAKTQLLAFLTINWAAGKVQEIVQIANAWNMMSARLKLATAGQREYTVAQKELFAIAQRIGVPIQETATLYGKLHRARTDLLEYWKVKTNPDPGHPTSTGKAPLKKPVLISNEAQLLRGPDGRSAWKGMQPRVCHKRPTPPPVTARRIS